MTFLEAYDQQKDALLKEFARRGVLFEPGTGEYTETAERAIDDLGASFRETLRQAE